jgi:Flp pilus assembly protein TadG
MTSNPQPTANETESRSRNQSGAILPMMAIMLIVLIGSAATAVDLGWLCWQSLEIQHGADAAALAGVIRLGPWFSVL